MIQQNKQNNEKLSIDLGKLNKPDVIQIKGYQDNYSLISLKHFKKDDYIFSLNQCFQLPTEIRQIKMKIEGHQYVCNEQHTIDYKKYRHYIGFCSFINHSCQPNSIFIKNKNKVNNLGKDLQQLYALRDIKIGQNLSCNYLYFYYDGLPSQMFKCNCGSQKCQKLIRGFKYISLEQKIRLLPYLYPQVKQLWLQDHKYIMLIQDMEIMPCIDIIQRQGDTFQIVARKNVKEGEKLFGYKPVEIDIDTIIIVKIKNNYKIVNKQFVQKSKNYFEYHKEFIIKSNNPNTTIICTNQYKIGIFLTDIQAGQKITLSYV